MRCNLPLPPPTTSRLEGMCLAGPGNWISQKGGGMRKSSTLGRSRTQSYSSSDRGSINLDPGGLEMLARGQISLGLGAPEDLQPRKKGSRQGEGTRRPDSLSTGTPGHRDTGTCTLGLEALLALASQVAGSQDTGTPGHRDTGTPEHRDTGTPGHDY